MIIAVDVDGTLTLDPSCKPINDMRYKPGSSEALWTFKNLGAEIVIFTARLDEEAFGKEECDKQEEILKIFLARHNIPFDRIFRGRGKVVFDYLLDDKAVNAKGPWDEIIAHILDKRPMTVYAT